MLFLYICSTLEDWVFQLPLLLVQMRPLSTINLRQKHVLNSIQIAFTYLILEHRYVRTYIRDRLVALHTSIFNMSSFHIYGGVAEVSGWNNWYYTDCSFWKTYSTWESMLYCGMQTLLIYNCDKKHVELWVIVTMHKGSQISKFKYICLLG